MILNMIGKSILKLMIKIFLTHLSPVHCLALNISEPDPEVRCEALPSQLQHGNVSPAVEMEGVHHGDRGDRVPDRAHTLVELVFNLYI